MLPILSIATSIPASRFRPKGWDEVLGLERAFSALQMLQTPWEWIIIGETEDIQKAVSFQNDERVEFKNGSPCAPLALNVALNMSKGLFWIHLDSASQLLPGVDKAIADLRSVENAAYAYGHTIDWEYESGVEVSVDMKGGFGLLAQADVAQRWETHHGWNFVPISALWRKEHLLACGGYPALVNDIETFPLVMASLEAPVLAVDVEIYKLTRFKEAPDRTGSIDFEAERNNLILHEHLRAKRRLYGKGLIATNE